MLDPVACFSTGSDRVIFPPGLIIGSLISARYGRRMTMFCMSVYALISATIVITSKTSAQILAGRTLNCTS